MLPAFTEGYPAGSVARISVVDGTLPLDWESRVSGDWQLDDYVLVFRLPADEPLQLDFGLSVEVISEGQTYLPAVCVDVVAMYAYPSDEWPHGSGQRRRALTIEEYTSVGTAAPSR